MNSLDTGIRINANKARLVLTTLALLLFVGLISINVLSKVTLVEADIYIRIFSWIGWILLIWCICSWYQLRNELLCPYVIFLSIAFVFMYGQSLLLAFNVIPEQRDIGRVFDALSLVKAQIFTVLGLGFFHLGALTFAHKPAYQVTSHISNVLSLKATKIVGWGLFLVSVGPFIYNSIRTIRLVYNSGYGGLYDPSLVATGYGKIPTFVGDFFIPALFCLLVVYAKRPFIRNVLLSFAIILIVSNLYIGGRSPVLVLIVCILCIWHYCVERITIKKATILLIAGYFFISILSVVANLRGMAERDLILYWTVFLESFGKDNLFIMTIAEMGGSMSPLVWVMNLVPSNFDFLYGSSYLYAFSTIIPNLGFWDVHPGALNSNLGSWLQTVLHLNYGPGFSPAAEAYINFGWFGFGAFFVLGSFYGRVFSLIHKNAVLMKPELICFVFVLLSFTLMTNRNSFIATIRAVFYYALPLYLLIKAVFHYLTINKGLKVSGTSKAEDKLSH